MLQGTSGGWLLGAAALVAACGSSTREQPCSAIESVRRQIYDVERADLDSDDWTKQQPPEQRHKAAEAIVSELEATCTTAHWSKQTIDCLIAGAKGAETQTEPASCKDGPSDKIVTRALDQAAERALVKQFGPRPRSAFEALTEKWDRWEQRRASSVEPRMVIPARYPGLAWFSRKASPMLRLLPVTPPACLDHVLSTVEGYYQAQPLGGEPSLIAVFGFLDRDPAEACLQEVAARFVPGARLERDGVLTRLITRDTVGREHALDLRATRTCAGRRGRY